MNYKIFQYVPMSKPKALSKVIPKLLKNNAKVILDVEDSVQDTLNPINTPILKQEAREFLPRVINKLLLNKINLDDKIYIRINSFESGELEKDLEIVKLLCEDLNTVGLFVPMVKNINDLYRVKKILGDLFEKIKIVPIIELVSGRDTLENILKNKDGLNIEFIHYGHYDYSLDSKQWPFLGQNEKNFWTFVNNFKNLVEKYDMHYMHTPFGQLSDKCLYQSVILELTKRCTKDFAVTALNFNQVLFANDIKNATSINLVEVDIDKKELAKEVVDIFENNQCSKRSFSVDIKKAKFLTPHEYKMAKIFLGQVS
jgi:hypothetical protein